MSLPTCQQRVLDTIETVLQRREPRLVSMFTMFTQLAGGEGMPRTERLEAVPWWAWRRQRRRRRTGRAAAPLHLLLLVPLAAIAVVVGIFLGTSAPQVPCTPTGGPHGPVAGLSHARSCPSGPGFRGFGRSPRNNG